MRPEAGADGSFRLWGIPRVVLRFAQSTRGYKVECSPPRTPFGLALRVVSLRSAGPSWGPQNGALCAACPFPRSGASAAAHVCSERSDGAMPHWQGRAITFGTRVNLFAVMVMQVGAEQRLPDASVDDQRLAHFFASVLLRVTDPNETEFRQFGRSQSASLTLGTRGETRGRPQSATASWLGEVFVGGRLRCDAVLRCFSFRIYPGR